MGLTRSSHATGFVHGSPYHVDLISELFALEGTAVSRGYCAGGTFLYHIYGVPSLRDLGLIGAIAYHATKRTLIFHWIGTDVLRYQDTSEGKGPVAKRLARRICLPPVYRRCTHFCGAPWLVDELACLGIKATFMPLPARLYVTRPEALPVHKTTFVSYIPRGREAFYGWEFVSAAAALRPECDWAIVGHDGAGLSVSKNVRFLGKVPPTEMRAVYDSCSGLVRLPEHDGLSLSVLEALSAGRYVIWNYTLEGCQKCERSLGSLLGAIEVVAASRAPNQRGQEVVRDHFQTNVLVRNLKEALARVGGGDQ